MRRLAWIAIAAGLAGLLPFAACRRQADIVDEPDAGEVKPNPTLDAGDIPELDSGLGGDAFPACSDRPPGECVGPVDFPCAFSDWATAAAVECQTATGCKTNGWLEVTMDPDGCVVAIGMDQPNDEIVACLLDILGNARCACAEDTLKYFFGTSNTGTCAECNTGELVCPAGEHCVGGTCVADDDAGGG